MDIKSRNLELFEAELKKLMTTPMRRRLFLSSLPFILSSCATTQHRNREGDNAGQTTSLNVQDEQRMTQEYLPQMMKEYPTLRDQELQSYIGKLGHNIAARNKLQGNPYKYRFRVVDAKMVNAFALPAGEVFVTAPLLAMAETEAELAGVIGHEIGHIKARHTAERIDAQEKSKNKSWLYTVGGGLVGSALGFGVGKLLCSKQDRECLQRAALYGAAAGAGGGLLIQKYSFMAHSREDEMEADRVGFRTSYNAGFDRNHVGTFYEKLLVMEKQYSQQQANGVMKKMADALSTHPPSEERVAQMKRMALSVPTKSNSVVTSNTFKRMKQKVQKYTSA